MRKPPYTRLPWRHTSLSILYREKGMVSEAEAEGNKARVLGWKQ
jgi:hypothetical protein